MSLNFWEDPIALDFKTGQKDMVVPRGTTHSINSKY